MAKRYNFLNEGSTTLPVEDATYETANMSPGDAFGDCLIAFYDENGDMVKPTAGTVLFESAAIDGQWLAGGEAIDATLCGPEATYTPPSFNSVVVRSRVTLQGVTGATTARAFHWRGA